MSVLLMGNGYLNVLNGNRLDFGGGGAEKQIQIHINQGVTLTCPPQLVVL